jgi:hypothetical protein
MVKKRKKSAAIGRWHKKKSRHLKQPAATEEPATEAATVLPTQEPSNTQILDEDDEFAYEIEDATLDDALPIQRVDDTVNKRLAIYYLFSTVFGNPTDRDSWVGKDGFQASIRNRLDIPATTTITDVFEDILECRKNEVAYDPSIRFGRGRTAIIDVESQQAQLIADVVEGCGSMAMATMVVNRYQESIEEEAVTKAAVQSCIRRMAPKVSRVLKRKQGKRDEDSAWAKARFLFTKQLMIRFGSLEPEGDNPPAYFDIRKLGSLSINQIGFWDETHKKCIIGEAAGKDFCFIFPRDENGKIKIDGGVYTETTKSQMNVKYENEVRLALGCGVVEKNGEEIAGRACDPFVYSSKVMITIKDRNKKRLLEMERVKGLKTGGRRWVVDNRVEGTLYRNDPVTKLKGCGLVVKRKFEANGIEFLSDLRALDEDGVLAIVNASPELSLTKRQVSLFKERATNVIDEDAPEVMDYRNESNPYLARFGENQWENEIDSSVSLSSFVCVTKLIEHMWKETEKMFKGSKHEDNWYIYHDALTLMTATDTKLWMEEKGYLKRWIRPKLGLFDKDPDLKAYRDRPPGDR